MVASNCWTTLRRFWPGHRTPTPAKPDKHRIGQRNLDRSHGPFDVPTSDGDPIGDSLRQPAMVSPAEKHAHNDPGGRPLSALAKRPQTMLLWTVKGKFLAGKVLIYARLGIIGCAVILELRQRCPHGLS